MIEMIFEAAALLGFPYVSYAFDDGLRGIPGSAIAWRNTCQRLKASEPEQEPVMDALYNKAREMGKETEMSLKFKKCEFDVLPVGEYRANVTDWEMAKENAHTAEYGPQVMVKMELQTPDGPRTLREFYGIKSFAPKSRIAGLFMAALNTDFDSLPDEPDMDDIIGLPFMATVLIKKKPNDGTEFNRIEGLRPLKQKASPKPAVASQGASTDAFDV